MKEGPYARDEAHLIERHELLRDQTKSKLEDLKATIRSCHAEMIRAFHSYTCPKTNAERLALAESETEYLKKRLALVESRVADLERRLIPPPA